MCSSHQPENGADSQDWNLDDLTGPAKLLVVSLDRKPLQKPTRRPVWPARAVNGGWDKPREEVSHAEG